MLCESPSSVSWLLQIDWLKGGDRVEVNTLFLAVIFSEMQPISCVKGPTDEIVLYRESNPAEKAVCIKWGNS